ncbi:MAG: histidine phosphatase family protein [Atopobiaceae bacterium]|nr:histidine phosphatase family protein [Atopobiaceae bacterium]
MALKIVLVRHGDAKSKKLGQTDHERELTKRGVAALREAFPQTFSLVEPTIASELWVSTAIRARQTADIANETLGIEMVRLREYLYEQDHQEFLDEISQTNADLVVVVGHIPFVEDACYQLIGTSLGFSTGAAAAIELSEQGRGRLLWFVQGPEC